MPSNLTPNEFCQVFADRILARDPRFQLEMRAELELGIFPPQEPGQSFTLSLENAYEDYMQDPRALRDVMERFISLTLQTFARAELEKLMPVVQGNHFLDLLVQGYIDAGYEPDEVDVYYEALNDELIVLLEVQREEGTVQYLTYTDMENMEMTADEVRAYAVGNLLDQMPHITCNGNNNLFVVSAERFPVASLLLAAPFWSHDTFPVTGDFIAAVPASDCLLVTGSDHEEAVESMRDFAENTAATSQLAISSAVFVMRDLLWDLYE